MFRFSHHHQGACYLSFAKVTVAKTMSYNHQLKYIVVVNSVVWPDVLSGPGWCMSVRLFGIRLLLKQNSCAVVGK